MPRILLIAVAAASIMFVACDGGDKKDADSDAGGETPAATRTRAPEADAGDLKKHEDELRETVPAAYKAIFAGGSVEAYKYASEDFKDKCSLEDFLGVIALVKVFLGDLDEEDVTVEITDIRYEDGKAYVTATGALNGETFEPDEGDDQFSDYWVYEDGAWRWGTEEEDPCDTSFGGTTSDDSTPATGPGSSRSEPAAIGTAVESGDLRITVLEADIDAASKLDTLTEFPSTPVPGRRVVLARIRVENTATDGDQTIQVYESDYKITGSANVLYDSFGEDTSCGFLDDTLQGEMFPGGSLEGYICFQVPLGETDLMLVAQPGFGFDDNSRRFFKLQ